MSYKDEADQLWRHHDLGRGDARYRAIIRYATLAASSHNTQPWQFRIEPGRIWILPDLSRRCPAVDPDDHHLYASLGCALENLLQAGRAAGLEGRPEYDPSTTGVKIEFEETTPVRTDLFESIPERQCSRVEFEGGALADREIELLTEAGVGDGVAILLITSEEQKEQVARCVAEGNLAQFADKAWAEELKSWIRFSAGEATHMGDGLYGPVMGSPSVPRWLGLLAMKFGFSAKAQNLKDFRNIKSSSAIAVLYSEVDDKRHWIEAGRCYERMALQAAALGLRTAFINQPVEVSALRPEFARFLGIGDRRPDLVIRIGHGPECPRSLRRPLADVLV
ncbi:nitroreductase family protein [Marinobacter pelagius]|uniref:Acg family FMN-binding oxidoreductase n=1 Tax=Marinobacter sp. C7 TaxID=2951363 RepID=UPI001EF08C18|nr:nitroreductase family protein [Marinobacter sp. C7]MCG7198815.1 nitroreductase family protein [Marinobacter sp. C7]